MKVSANLAFVATLIASAAATPLADTTKDVLPAGSQIQVFPNGLPEDLIPIASGAQKRATTMGVYLCNDRNFQGYCVHINSPPQVCVPLGPDLEDQVTSVGPDQHEYCLFYGDRNCQDGQSHFGLTYPGAPDLSVPSFNFNDKISSYNCVPY